jgi:hypothetical protein
LQDLSPQFHFDYASTELPRRDRSLVTVIS